MEKRATIVDVAKAAGVSTATVSYILNRTEGHSFTEETIQRVYDAVRQLDYVRSPSARRPRESVTPRETKRTKNVCVAYATVSLRVQIILQGLMQVLREAGYNVLQTPIEVDIANKRIKALDQYFSDNVEGIICLGLAGWSMGESWSDIIVERRVPFICVDCQWDRNISSVEVDYLSGAYEVVTALIRGGVNKFYYIHDPNQPPQTQERLRGIRRAIFEAGANVELITHVDPLILNPFVTYSTDEMDYADSAERLAMLMDGLDQHSAILLDWADHNQFALRLCMERGLSIPIAALERGTLSPVAFPNLYYSALPLHDMGVAAANALLRQLKDPNDITHELLLPTLVCAE